ncbi:unnamed protein product [Mytilus edulis]|uniref:Uncharacterized protein n=1 Tax=Mytilus edulis TaxID=6550 RepID=A0A8S3TI61_MYTED|nr:unnamed protein product [Mytilus edulis]
MDLIAQFVGILMVFVINIAEGVEGVAYGEDCSSATCDDTHNICDTGKTNVCICDTGFFRKPLLQNVPHIQQHILIIRFDLQIIGFALNKVCEAAQTASDQCSIANSECRDDSGTDKCLCKPTHYETGGACVLKVGLDGNCDTTDSATDQCSVVDTECRDDGTESKCLCKTTHYSDGSACVIKFAGLDTTCNGAVSATDQCSAADTECRDDGAGSKCLCIDTHYSDGSACQTKIALNAACTDGHPVDQCKDTLAECRDESGFKCLCKTNNFENKDVTCAAQVGLDGTCDTTDSATDQCSVVDTECRDDGTESKCLCKTTHYSDGSACVIKFAGIDTTCNSAVSTRDQCSAADTECRDDGAGLKCLCKATHYSDGSACQTRIKPNIACTAAGQCVTHATCDTTDTDTCVCDASYTPSPIINPTMCSGVVKFSTQKYTYVVPILVSMMFLLR